MGNESVAAISSHVNLPPNDYKTLMNVVAKLGPVSVTVASHRWALYKGGVFEVGDKWKPSATDLNHAVVLMGYGTDGESGDDYWLVRNSWGLFWGEDGYIRLKRADPSTLDDPESDCGMD